MAKSIDRSLNEYVHAALCKGVSKQDIRLDLLDAGWSEDQSDRALNEFADGRSGLPVPRPTTSLSPKEAFLYCLMFVALYVSASYIVVLLWQIVNLQFPEVGSGRTYSIVDIRKSIRSSIAAIACFFPVYIWLFFSDRKKSTLTPTRRRSAIRRWLTYLTLLITAITLLTDFAITLFQYLDGSLTIRFFLKTIAVGIVAGGVLAFYSYEMRQDEG